MRQLVKVDFLSRSVHIVYSRRAHVLVAALVIVVALSPLGTVPQNVEAVSQFSLNDTDPLLGDAQVYASNMGVSLDEAIRRFQLQDIAGNLDAELSVKESETFAGLWLEHTPEFRLVVRFTRNAEETIRPYIPKDLADIVEVRAAKVSLADLQKAQDEVLFFASGLNIPVESGINVFENRVELYVADPIRFNAALQRGEVRLPDNVKVITVEAMGKPDADIYGGLPLSDCTSGFAVRQPDGLNGITTAAHCSNSQSYSGTSLTFKNQLYSGSYDIQWHTAPGFTVTNKIQVSSSGSTRNITATKHRNNQVIGGYVCKYGMTSGYTCGYISDKNYCPAWVPSCATTYILVDNTAGYSDLSSAGDSGGPWFLVNTAYGTHSGWPGADPNDAVYMAVNYVGGLGVSVMTSP